MGRVIENYERSYKCGKCGKIVYYSINDTAPDCPQCGWTFLTDSQYNVPTPVFPLS